MHRKLDYLMLFELFFKNLGYVYARKFYTPEMYVNLTNILITIAKF